MTQAASAPDEARAQVRDAEQMVAAAAGAHIRRVRLCQRLTLKEIAGRAGVSVSMLSMLERGVSTASIGTLVAVTEALRIPMSDLFVQRIGAADSPVTRLVQQVIVETGEGATARLAHNDVAGGVQFTVREFEPGVSVTSSELPGDDREVGVIVTGRLAVTVDGQVHLLDRGDMVSSTSRQLSHFENTGDQRVVAVWMKYDRRQRTGASKFPTE